MITLDQVAQGFMPQEDVRDAIETCDAILRQERVSKDRTQQLLQVAQAYDIETHTPIHELKGLLENLKTTLSASSVPARAPLPEYIPVGPHGEPVTEYDGRGRKVPFGTAAAKQAVSEPVSAPRPPSSTPSPTREAVPGTGVTEKDLYTAIILVKGLWNGSSLLMSQAKALEGILRALDLESESDFQSLGHRLRSLFTPEELHRFSCPKFDVRTPPREGFERNPRPAKGPAKDPAKDLSIVTEETIAEAYLLCMKLHADGFRVLTKCNGESRFVYAIARRLGLVVENRSLESIAAELKGAKPLLRPAPDPDPSVRVSSLAELGAAVARRAAPEPARPPSFHSLAKRKVWEQKEERFIAGKPPGRIIPKSGASPCVHLRFAMDTCQIIGNRGEVTAHEYQHLQRAVEKHGIDESCGALEKKKMLAAALVEQEKQSADEYMDEVFG